MISALCFLFLLNVLVLGADVSCAGSDASNMVIPQPNKCQSTPDTPFCVDISNHSTHNYVCRACVMNCDCDLTQYCIKDSSAGANRGTCTDLDPGSNTVWNQPCNNFVSPYAFGSLTPEEVATPVKGVNDKMVCGKPVFLSNNSFGFYEWLGFCDQGACKQCASYGDYLGPSVALLMSQDPSFLMCVGRACQGGNLVIPVYAQEPGDTNINVDLPTGIDAAILVFVIFLCIMNLFLCVCSIKGRLDKWKYKRVPQRA